MNKVLLSECCGSPPWFETGLCSSCREHADFIDISKKKKDDWFDSHVEVIGLDDKTNKEIKDKIKEKLEKEITNG